jgi:putative ABC transport system permease protein
MFLMRFAFKNLFRNPRRTALSLVSVVAGVAVYILGQGAIGGVKENVLRAQIDSVSSHVQTLPAGYPSDMMSHPIDELYPVDAETSEWLDHSTRAWTRRVLFSPDVIFGSDSMRIRGIAFESGDADVFPRDNWGVDGKIPVTAADGVLIGKGPAKILGIQAGDWITVRARTVNGAINALQVPVAGVVSSGSPVIDATAILFPWELSDQLIQHGGSTSHLHIRLNNRNRVDTFGPEVSERLGDGVQFQTYLTETADIMRLQDVRQRILNFIAFTLLAIAATGIANTILMAAYERFREIGTLQAMGMNRADVIRLFLIEGTYLGVLGGVLGAGLGGAAVYYWSTVGIDISAAIEASGDTNNNIPFSTMLYFEFRADVIVLGFVIGVVIALVSSVYPAFVASRMNPADAVRG